MSRETAGVAMASVIVNADDFGFFDQVSRGILEAAEAGVVSATGIMANGPALDRWLDRLRSVTGLSVGVHLNATLGIPLTATMARALDWNGGRFTPKGSLVAAVLRGRIPLETVLEEWRAQIRHCLDRGLALDFVNSHEHIHMLPGLYGKVLQLAQEHGVRHVRAPQPEWGPRLTGQAVLRSAVMAAARVLSHPQPTIEPVLIGVSPSGQMDLTYCRWRFPRLARNHAYELMCHPGHHDPAAVAIPSLRHYHDWAGELQTLLSSEFSELLQQNHLRIATYADLRASQVFS